MKRGRSKDISEDFAATKRKILNLKKDELQTIYSGHGLPKKTLKNDLQTALSSIVEGKCELVTIDVRDAIIRKIESFDKLTNKQPKNKIENYYKIFSEMPNQISFKKGLNIDAIKQNFEKKIENDQHSTIKMKAMPFYDLLAVLLPLSPLNASSNAANQIKIFNFYLSKDQVEKIHNFRHSDKSQNINYDVQVMMRFCLYDTSSEQTDSYPISFEVLVNNRPCPLPNHLPCRPGETPKRPPKPLDVTRFLKITPNIPNKIEIRWKKEIDKTFAIAGFLVHKRTSSELFERLNNKGVMPSECTRELIKKNLDEGGDNEIATTMLRLSLICPLGKIRMVFPCRASTCMHLQCFDALFYLQMNELNPKWNCPVCNKEILFDNLVIDGYFLEIIASLDKDSTEVQFHKDGTWTKLKKEKQKDTNSNLQLSVDIEILSSEDEDNECEKNNNKPDMLPNTQKNIELQQQYSRRLMNGDLVDLTEDDE